MSIEKIESSSDGYLIATDDQGNKTKFLLNAAAVVSSAPAGFKKVTDIYVEPVSGQLVVIHEE